MMYVKNNFKLEWCYCHFIYCFVLLPSKNTFNIYIFTLLIALFSWLWETEILAFIYFLKPNMYTCEYLKEKNNLLFDF